MRDLCAGPIEVTDAACCYPSAMFIPTRVLALGVLVWMTACSGPRIVAGGSGGDGGRCADLEDEDPGPAVTVRLVNPGDRPVYVTTVASCVDARVEVKAAGASSDARWPADSCTSTCSDLMAGECACPLGCAASSLLRIDPGGVFEAPWPGLLYLPDEIPEACLPQDTCNTARCPVLRVPSAGMLEVSASFIAEPGACDPITGDPRLCACTPNQAGWCLVQADGVDGAEVVTATFPYPESSQVDLPSPFAP